MADWRLGGLMCMLFPAVSPNARRPEFADSARSLPQLPKAQPLTVLAILPCPPALQPFCPPCLSPHGSQTLRTMHADARSRDHSKQTAWLLGKRFGSHRSALLSQSTSWRRLRLPSSFSCAWSSWSGFAILASQSWPRTPAKSRSRPPLLQPPPPPRPSPRSTSWFGA